MDDVVLYALEQVAYYGSRGATLPQVWKAISDFYSDQGLAQTLDEPFKSYLWTFLDSCEELSVGKRAIKKDNIWEIEEIPPPTNNLDQLQQTYGEALTVRATEERQWMTLTGHTVDNKKVPPLSFACLSAISAGRADGLSLIDLYTETGQDKRSAPNRCKRLAEQGLVYGFPILARGAITTLYVHHHFLLENMRRRAAEHDYGGKRRVLDLHSLRLGISDWLKRSTNQILKIQDCCKLMKMDTEQADAWTQSRFYSQVRLLASKGFVKILKVPGKLTGSLFRCVQLVKEYQDMDNLVADDVVSAEELAQQDLDRPEEDSNDEDLDFLYNRSSQTTEILVARDALLEWIVHQITSEAGETGISSTELCSRVVGSHWSRPIDEQLKRICPDLSYATQPAQYASLALAPAVQETMGKIRQYRYYKRQNSGTSEDASETEHHIDGHLPPIGADLELMTILPDFRSSSAIVTPLPQPAKRGRPRKTPMTSTLTLEGMSNISPNPAPPSMPSSSLAEEPDQLPVKKRGRPSKQMLEQRKQMAAAQIHSTQNEAQAESTHILPKKRGRPSKAMVAARQAIELNACETVSTEAANMIPLVPESTVKQYSSTVAPDPSNILKRNASNEETPTKRTKLTITSSARDSLRKVSTNSTAQLREHLLLEIVDLHHGIISVDVDLCREYDKLLQERTGVTQSTDKNTIKRTLAACKLLKSTTRSFEDYAGRGIARSIYYLKTLDEKDDVFQQFIRQTRVKEKTRKPPQAAHKVIEVVVRPEMEILPSIWQTRANKQVATHLRTLSGDIRIRLPEKMSTHERDSTNSWYIGDTRLLSFREACAANREAAAQAKKDRDQRKASALVPVANAARPRLKRILPKSAIDVQEKSTTTQESMGPNSSGRAEKSMRIRASHPRKTVSKREDRFLEPAEAAEDDVDPSQPTRRRVNAFTEYEDETLIRAASLSMLFFSKSETQFKIDWDLVDLAVSHHECRKRYATIRNRPRHRDTQNFIHSETFFQLYNEAVISGDVLAVPRESISADGTPYDIRPLVDFTRRFSAQTRISRVNDLPSNLADVCEDYYIEPLESLLDGDWKESVFSANSSSIKSQLLKSTAFFSAKSEESFLDSREAHLKSAIKSLLLTREADYDVKSGEDFLLKFANKDQVNCMIDSMTEENLIVGAKGDAARLTPGRNSQLSEKFFSRFRGSVDKKTLKNARHFYQLLEESFSKNKTALFSSLSNNGASAATLELALRGYLSLYQGKKKWTEYGLIQDYAVRHIDETLLDFGVILDQTSRSLANPDVDLTMQDEQSEVPCFWIDIHGKVMEGAYHGAVSLLIDLLVTRGCMSVDEMMHRCSPVFLRHEIETCLGNLERTGCVQYDNGVYSLRDHYFNALV